MLGRVYPGRDSSEETEKETGGGDEDVIAVRPNLRGRSQKCRGMSLEESCLDR